MKDHKSDLQHNLLGCVNILKYVTANLSVLLIPFEIDIRREVKTEEGKRTTYLTTYRLKTTKHVCLMGFLKMSPRWGDISLIPHL